MIERFRKQIKKFEKASNEIDSLLSKANENIINYIKMQFHERYQ